MTSILRECQVDYLVESVQCPNRKVKEGFHALMIETRDDQEMAGVLVRETDDQLIVRDASNREVSIPKNNIAKRTIGGSIMPAGLIDALSEQEQAHLYRFLSELGRPGAYDASKGNVARVWQVLPRTLDVSQFTDDKVVTADRTGTIDHNQWEPIATLVDGRLLKSEFERVLRAVHYRDPDAIYAKTKFQVARSGPVHIALPQLAKATVWVDGKQVPAQAEVVVELSSGPAHAGGETRRQIICQSSLRAGSPDGTFRERIGSTYLLGGGVAPRPVFRGSTRSEHLECRSHHLAENVPW